MKRLTNEDRIKQMFAEVDEMEARLLLFMAGYIVGERFPATAPAKAKRGRGRAKPKAYFVEAEVAT